VCKIAKFGRKKKEKKFATYVVNLIKIKKIIVPFTLPSPPMKQF
jgi:hypothetical protein